MSQKIAHTRLTELHRLLQNLARLHDKLARVVRLKVDAMRGLDLGVLQTEGDRERAIVQRIHEQEGLRRRWMDEIGQTLGMRPGAARRMTASQLASRLDERQRDEVGRATDALRQAVLRVARVNQVAGVVSRELVGHLRWVFAAVNHGGGVRVGYTDSGAPASAPAHRILETLG